MFKTIKWLWAVYRLRKIYFSKNILFSGRKRRLEEVRPILSETTRIGYPDAFFHITDDDIKRIEW